MKARNKKTPSAHEGSADLVSVIEKVVPFLFSKKKKEKQLEEIARKEEKKWKAVSKKAKKIEATVRTGKPLKKSAKTARTSKLPAATLTVKKETKKQDGAMDVLMGSSSSDVPVASVDGKKPKGAFILKEEEKPKGALVLQEEEDTTEHDKEQASALAAQAEEDAFLSKVALKKASAAPGKKLSGWSIFGNRFFSRDKSESKAETKAPELTEAEMKNDSFLQRVEKKKTNSVVGTALDPEDPNSSKIAGKDVEMLDDMLGLGVRKEQKVEEAPKGRILSAADLRKETKEAKEAALRLEKEVKEIKEEMRSSKKDREKDLEKMDKELAEKKKEPAPSNELRVNKKAKYKKKGGLQQFLAAFGHIGLGKERMRFVENLATMLNAGLPLIDSLQTLKLETRTKPMKKLLQQILDSVENGSPLWRAMEEQSFFSLHALALIRIGEEAGNLAENMEYLSRQETKDNELRSKVKMAMIYPTIVMVIMFIIVIGLGWFVLPNLIGVLYSLNVELPFVTRMVIAFTNAFTEHGVIGVPAFMVGMFIFMILAKYTRLRGLVQWVMFRIPGIGALARQATIARFGVILGGLLKAGVPVVEAMQSLVDVTPIVAYRNLYSKMLDHITIGDSFSKSFAAIKGSDKLLPPSVQQLVITGEKSGALADIMLKVADIYDRKASETAQKLPVILEPMLLLFIGGLVGTIAFAIIVPIYSIVGTVGRG